MIARMAKRLSAVTRTACSLAAGLLVLVPLTGCGLDTDAADTAPPPVVLITFGSLRIDAVGYLGGAPDLTPNLDAFAAEADWAGTAVAASSEPHVALASLLSGVDPWQHQLLSVQDTSRPHRRWRTLGQALGQAGYRATCFLPRPDLMKSLRLYNGFQLNQDDDPGDYLANLEGAELVWVHVPQSSPPFIDRRQSLPRLADRPDPGRSRVRRPELLPFLDPTEAMPEDFRRATRELYFHGVAAGDDRVGQLLESLRTSGRWSDSLVVVTAVLGFELGEHQSVLYGQNLGREVIEVPMVIKLPEGTPALAEPTTLPVAAGRLFGTVATAAGVEPAPVHLPSLFMRDRDPILSSLYLRNGRNHFSIVTASSEGIDQLIWRKRFVEPEAEYYLAQRARPGGGSTLSEHPLDIFLRLQHAFRQSKPLSARSIDSPIELDLRRWVGPRQSIQLDDQGLRDRRASELRRRWMRFVDKERTPEEQSLFWR